MGYSLALDGKRDKAQKYYEKTLEIDPDNVAALNNLANIFLDQGKEDEALKYLKYTTQMHPDYAEAWINLGLINEEANKVDEAMKCYDRAKDLILVALPYGTIEDMHSDDKASLERR